MYEQDDFAPRETVTEGLPSPPLARLHERDGLLHVELVPYPLGWPRRHWRPKNMPLSPGQTLRWQINYRFSGYDDWSYRQDTLHLAYRCPSAHSVFLTPPPTR